MAELLAGAGRIEDARRVLGRAIDFAPGFGAAREALARLLLRQRHAEEALAQIEPLLADYPAEPALVLLQTGALIEAGEIRAAADALSAMLAIHPGEARAWVALGNLSNSLGAIDGAVAAYRSALAVQPGLGVAWWGLANLKTVRFSAQDIAAMRAALEDAGDPADRAHLHFALGKALADAGEDAGAFAAYAEANRIRRAQLPYDAGVIHAQCTREAALFTTAFLAARAEGGCPAPDPIFVVGLPRSGSTLVEQILASHSQVEGLGELPDIMAIAADLAAREPARYPEMLADLTPADRRRLGEVYMDRTRRQRREGRPRFIDKMPNNWLHVGLIRLILPDARIIDVRRHPLACGWSCFTQNFAKGQAFSYDLADLGRFYRDYAATMAHVDRVMPGRVHRLIYERLVSDPEAEVRALLAALGLPFEDSCLAFWHNRRAVLTPSAGQVRRPITADAVDHWRRFEPWLGQMKDALGPIPDVYP
jgi:tetratricopeptide (TPR) repeat protein